MSHLVTGVVLLEGAGEEESVEKAIVKIVSDIINRDRFVTKSELIDLCDLCVCLKNKSAYNLISTGIDLIMKQTCLESSD